MNARNIMAVAGREFRSFFDQATAYILLVVFLAANFFFYFRTVFLTAEATLRPMFDLMPWLLLFFVPAVCMRSLAEERSRGTLELVRAQPISGVEFLLGKFLGIMGFMAVALGGTLGAAVALRLGGTPYFGVMVAQYAGALLLTGALVAIGLWASALTRNQITAFIAALSTIFVLMAITLQVVLAGLPPVLAAAASYERNVREEFGREHDPVRLLGQDNVHRYLPVREIRLRVHPRDGFFDLYARVAAARAVGARATVSRPPGVTTPGLRQLEELIAVLRTTGF